MPGSTRPIASPAAALLRLTDLDGDALRPRGPSPRRPAERAAQPGRHHQGAMADVPEPGLAAALRSWAGARDDRDRHVRSPRHDLQCAEPGRPRREVRRRPGRRTVPQRPRSVDRRPGQVRPGPQRSASDDLVLQGCAGRCRRHPAPRPGAGAGPGLTSTCGAELDVVVSVANVPHVLDRRTDYSCTAVRITAWRGAPARATARAPGHSGDCSGPT